MKKRTGMLLSAGAVVGVLLAFVLFGDKREPQTQTVRVNLTPAGAAQQTGANMALIQGGTAVGYLTQGAKLWSRPNAAPGEQLQLLLEWNDNGTFEMLFQPVADDGTPAARKASAFLETRR